MADGIVNQIHEHFNRCDDDLKTAIAIVDCVRILTALERAPAGAVTPGKPLTGEGFANGDTLRDSSMPLALRHAIEMMQMAHNEADVMREMALDALREREEVRNG